MACLITPFVLNTNGMATPGRLISEMASALGLTRATVTQYDRALSEAGLRSKSGRGRSASKITPLDAANLLIGILGSPISGTSIRDAPTTCRVYGSQRVRVAWPKDLRRWGLHRLATLPEDHTLLDGVVALFEGAAAGEYIKIPRSKEMERKNLYWANACLHLSLVGPIPWAEITVSDLFEKDGAEVRIVYQNPTPSKDSRAALRQTRSTWKDSHAALTQTRSTTFAPMVALRNLFPRQSP